ncbi:sulfate adenylyltransferase subunit CysN [soil metagenome]
MADFGGEPINAQAADGQAELLRVLTCGSVDDGKSTLLGRLIFEAGAAPQDTLDELYRDSKRRGLSEPDYSLLLDGLEAERAQGITIDVAYRFFATPRRAFIVADAPGHEQYTRNMATGASTADLAILLVDARKGLLPQTRRHAAICSLLGVRQVILAINKMDLVGWDEAVFDRLVAAFAATSQALNFKGVQAIPLSAKSGGNLSTREAGAPWYSGPTLLEHLETAPAGAVATGPFRFPVQWVNRPNADFRGFSGTVASGEVNVGDPVVAAASGRTSTVARIVTADGDQAVAAPGDAVTLVLADEIDITRGDLLSAPRDRPAVGRAFTARLVWLDEAPLRVNDPYLLKIGGRTLPARITALRHGVKVEDLSAEPLVRLDLNGIAEVEIETTEPLAFDGYAANRRTGAFILIDRTSRATAGAGLILEPLSGARDVHLQAGALTRADRERLAGHRGACAWITGLSGAGKSTLADALEQALHVRGVRTALLDGDNLRHGLNADLGFSPEARAENLRRTGEVAKLFVQSGVVAICALISPLRVDRERIRALVTPVDFVEVFVDAPVALCRARDAKGLYAKADRGEIAEFTGVSSPYEPPLEADVVLDAAAEYLSGQFAAVIDALERRGVLGDPQAGFGLGI